jgi:hypothetical protein
MAEALTTEATPLIRGADGVMRVRGTRVTLDSIFLAAGKASIKRRVLTSLAGWRTKTSTTTHRFHPIADGANH